LTARPVIDPLWERNYGEENMLRLRYLLPAFAMALISSAPSLGETIIDEWANVKAPAPPELKSVTVNPSGATVIYSLFPSPNPATFPNPVIGDYVPAVAPKGDEPVVTSFVDKFAIGDKDTGLQKILKDKGITTVIPVGTTPHNGVLFTSVAAAFRGFNPVVPVDGMSGNNAYEDQAAAYILGNSIVYKVTLTSIDKISFAN
jgi:hypothetical protein